MNTITISEKQYLELVRNAFEDLKFKCKNRNWLNFNKKEFKKEKYYVSVVDINNLKIVNDTKGHNAGDNYIQNCINIIQHFFQESNKFWELVRFGGDEFLILSKINPNPLKKRLGSLAALGTVIKKRNIEIYQSMKIADKIMYVNKLKFKEANNE